MPWQPSFIHVAGWLRGPIYPSRNSTEIKKKIKKKKTKTVKMLPVKALTRKRLIGSKT